MRVLTRTFHSWSMIPAVAAAVLFSNAPAAAQQAAQNTVLYACYVPSTGTVYRIKAPGLPSECTTHRNDRVSHIEFSWNEQGVKGDPGPVGPAGVAGERGPEGPEGPAGRPGADGAPGAAGVPGPQGETGPKGDPGPRGEPGPRGDVGPQGETGPKGDPGDRGEPGPRGESGPQGEVGPRGETGEKGDPGNDGAPGAAGEKGEQGPRGPQGETGPAGVPGTTDHRQLTNLDKDDHPQYVRTDGARGVTGNLQVFGNLQVGSTVEARDVSAISVSTQAVNSSSISTNLLAANSLRYRGGNFSSFGTFSGSVGVLVPTGTTTADWNIIVMPLEMGRLESEQAFGNQDNALIRMTSKVTSTTPTTFNLQCIYTYRWGNGVEHVQLNLSGTCSYLMVPR